jgi:uncharacterized cupredoxin-like copper-binding protein
MVVPIAASLLLLGSACSNDDEGSSGGGSIDVTEQDFEITLDPKTSSAGSVTFTIHNDGPSTHEFVVFKTDLAPDALPTTSDGAVDEEGQGVEAVDEQEDIESGTDETLTVSLDAGSYVVICNLPGHYGQGMHAALEVS